MRAGAHDDVVAGHHAVDQVFRTQHLHRFDLHREVAGAGHQVFRSDTKDQRAARQRPETRGQRNLHAVAGGERRAIAIQSSLEQVHRRRADEARDEAILRRAVDFERRALLDDADELQLLIAVVRRDELIGPLVRNICYNNAKEYLGMAV